MKMNRRKINRVLKEWLSILESSQEIKTLSRKKDLTLKLVVEAIKGKLESNFVSFKEFIYYSKQLNKTLKTYDSIKPQDFYIVSKSDNGYTFVYIPIGGVNKVLKQINIFTSFNRVVLLKPYKNTYEAIIYFGKDNFTEIEIPPKIFKDPDEGIDEIVHFVRFLLFEHNIRPAEIDNLVEFLIAFIKKSTEVIRDFIKDGVIPDFVQSRVNKRKEEQDVDKSRSVKIVLASRYVETISSLFNRFFAFSVKDESFLNEMAFAFSAFLGLMDYEFSKLLSNNKEFRERFQNILNVIHEGTEDYFYPFELNIERLRARVQPRAYEDSVVLDIFFPDIGIMLYERFVRGDISKRKQAISLNKSVSPRPSAIYIFKSSIFSKLSLWSSTTSQDFLTMRKYIREFIINIADEMDKIIKQSKFRRFNSLD